MIRILLTKLIVHSNVVVIGLLHTIALLASQSFSQTSGESANSKSNTEDQYCTVQLQKPASSAVRTMNNPDTNCTSDEKSSLIETSYETSKLDQSVVTQKYVQPKTQQDCQQESKSIYSLLYSYNGRIQHVCVYEDTFFFFCIITIIFGELAHTLYHFKWKNDHDFNNNMCSNSN